MSILKKFFSIKKDKEQEEFEKDFKLRTPFWDYVSKNYKISSEFLNYIQQIDKDLEKIINGEIDMGNGNVLDDGILLVKEEELKKLEIQRNDHRVLNHYYDIRKFVDQKGFKKELEYLQEELVKNKEKQKIYVDFIASQEFCTSDKERG